VLFMSSNFNYFLPERDNFAHNMGNDHSVKVLDEPQYVIMINLSHLYVSYLLCWVLPFIDCSEPTQNDQAHFFSDIFLKIYNISTKYD
jgi:hypothetical protein